MREAHALKREMGPIALSAQYQQSPVPPGGTIIKRKWLKTYDELRSRPPLFRPTNCGTKQTLYWRRSTMGGRQW